MSLADAVIERLAQESEHFPPASLLVAVNECINELEELEPKQSPIVAQKVAQAFSDVFALLPPALRRTREQLMDEFKRAPRATLTVPLYDIIQNCGEAILALGGPFCGGELRNAGLYIGLRRRLLTNEASLSNASIYDPFRKVISADEYDAPPEELVKLYLAGTPFLKFMYAPVPFEIPRTKWASHAVILAPPNFGKSQLLGIFLWEALEDTEPRAIVLLDPHGDLFKVAKTRADPERLIVIDPDTDPPDLNILDYGVLSQHDALEAFKFLLSSLAGGLSPKQETSIPSLFELLNVIPDANFITLHEIITEKPKRGQPSKFAPAIQQLDIVHQDFFNELFHSGNYQETRDALQWKMLAAIGRPAFKKMFSAKRNSINIDRFIRERKVVLVKGGENSLGKEGMRIFLLFLVSQFFAAGKRRDQVPKSDRHLAMMLVDEAHTVLQSPVISDILVELRKYNCSFTAATQVWHQVAEAVRPAILGATAIKIVGAIQHNDAMVLAREMYTTGDFIRSMRAVEGSHADWVFYVQGLTDKAVKVRCRYGVLEELPKRNDLPLQQTRPPEQRQGDVLTSALQPLTEAEENVAQQLSTLCDDIKKDEGPEKSEPSPRTMPNPDSKDISSAESRTKPAKGRPGRV